MNSKYLYFNSTIGSKKPVNINNQQIACPFCDRQTLTDIIDQDGEILLIKNKYPVLEQTEQTVLIETAACDTELSLYNKDHLYRLIAFGFKHWLAMEQDPQFSSVLFYKNHGPLSGGTIRHPHMQIVGLKNYDYRPEIKPEYFTGESIAEHNQIALTLSTQPRIGFFEFNITGQILADLHQTADYIQLIAHYVLNHLNKYCNSYNIFFYHTVRGIAVKIMPRFITSPLYIGYAIPQLPSRLNTVITEIKTLYGL